MKELSKDSKEKKARKLLDTLNKVYDLTKDDYVSLTRYDLQKICSMSTNSVYVLKNNFLDAKKDYTRMVKGMSYQYKWKSIKPNIHMARKFHEEIYKYSRKQYIKGINKQQSEHNLFNQPKQEVPKNEVVKKEVIKKEIQKKEQKTKEVNLFWGLIKIKY
jgi:hypothetical protein